MAGDAWSFLSVLRRSRCSSQIAFQLKFVAAHDMLFFLSTDKNCQYGVGSLSQVSIEQMFTSCLVRFMSTH